METDAKPSEPKSAHTSSRKGARMSPIELITRGERRRWTVEQKPTIAAQSLVLRRRRWRASTALAPCPAEPSTTNYLHCCRGLGKITIRSSSIRGSVKTGVVVALRYAQPLLQRHLRAVNQERDQDCGLRYARRSGGRSGGSPDHPLAPGTPAPLRSVADGMPIVAPDRPQSSSPAAGNSLRWRRASRGFCNLRAMIRPAAGLASFCAAPSLISNWSRAGFR